MAEGMSRRLARPFGTEAGGPEGPYIEGVRYDARGLSSREESEKEQTFEASSIRSHTSTESLGTGEYGGAERDGTESPIYRPPSSVRVDGVPLNFALVVPGVYRSSFPVQEDYTFLQSLRLTTIITLRKTTFEPHYLDFMKSSSITHHTFDMQGTKKAAIPAAMMREIMAIVLDPRKYPLLIHCNQGLHRTGCAAAVLKLIRGYDVESVIKEYTDLAGHKVRSCDLAYIRNYDISVLQDMMISNAQPRASLVNQRLSRTLYVTMIVLAFWYGVSLLVKANHPRRSEQ